MSVLKLEMNNQQYNPSIEAMVTSKGSANLVKVRKKCVKYNDRSLYNKKNQTKKMKTKKKIN